MQTLFALPPSQTKTETTKDKKLKKSTRNFFKSNPHKLINVYKYLNEIRQNDTQKWTQKEAFIQ
jgi:phosphopantetheinyl transferase